MKTLILLAALFTVGFAAQARAQGSGGFTLCGSDSSCVTWTVLGLGTGVVSEALIAAGGVFFGTATSMQLARGVAPRPWWSILSFAFGASNIVIGGLWSAVAGGTGHNEGFVLLAVAHFAVGAFDLASGTLGVIRALPVAPTLVSGRDAAGKRWTGLGLTLASF